MSEGYSTEQDTKPRRRECRLPHKYVATFNIEIIEFYSIIEIQKDFFSMEFLLKHFDEIRAGPALEVQIVGEFPLKSKIWRPKPKYLVRIWRLRCPFFPWRLREIHALYPPSAGPGYEDFKFY
jgi:hypothetical protein